MSDYRRTVSLTLDEDLISDLKAEAAREQCSLDELVENLLLMMLTEIEMERATSEEESRRRSTSSAAPETEPPIR